MTICKFFIEGRCRFGNNCKFEHSYPQNTGNFHNYSSPNYYDDRNTTSVLHRGSQPLQAPPPSYSTTNYNNRYNFPTTNNSRSIFGGTGGTTTNRAPAFTTSNNSTSIFGGTGGTTANQAPAFTNNTSLFRGTAGGAITANRAPAPFTNNSSNQSNTVETANIVKSVISDATQAEKGSQWLLSCYAPFKEKAALPGFEDYSVEEMRYHFNESVKNNTLPQYQQNLQTLQQEALARLKMLQSPSNETIAMLRTIYDEPPSSSAGVYQGATALKSTPSEFRILFDTPDPFKNTVRPITTPSPFGGQSTTNNSNLWGSTNNSNQPQPEQMQAASSGGSSNLFQRTGDVSKNASPLFVNSGSAPLNTTPGIFGGLVKAAPSGSGGNKNPDLYSKIEDLSPADLKWFNSGDLDIDNIPEVPPTADMCF